MERDLSRVKPAVRRRVCARDLTCMSIEVDSPEFVQSALETLRYRVRRWRMGTRAPRPDSHALCGAAVNAPLLAHQALTARRWAPHLSRHLPELVAVQRRPTATWGKVRGNHRDLSIRVNRHALSKLGFAPRHPLWKNCNPPKGVLEFIPFDQSHEPSKVLNRGGCVHWTNTGYPVPDHTAHSSHEGSALEVFLLTGNDDWERSCLDGEIRDAVFRLTSMLHEILVRGFTEARAPLARKFLSENLFETPQVSLGPPPLRQKLLQATRYRYQA